MMARGPRALDLGELEYRMNPIAWIFKIWDYLKDHILLDDDNIVNASLARLKLHIGGRGPLPEHRQWSPAEVWKGNYIVVDIHEGECGSDSLSYTMASKDFWWRFY
jgi:hypothetical protein